MVVACEAIEAAYEFAAAWDSRGDWMEIDRRVAESDPDIPERKPRMSEKKHLREGTEKRTAKPPPTKPPPPLPPPQNRHPPDEVTS
jgi:hypothetical protein